jgi:cbb3-type cytochrome c oxidase subunit III
VTRTLGLLLVTAGLLVLATGCGAGTGGVSKSKDAAAGKPLFVQYCGSCHTLKAAGTNGTRGPDLDASIGPVRKQGFKLSTIQQVVLDQIRFASCTDNIREDSPSSCMPSNLVRGAEAESVAAYVAYAAGNPEAQKETGGGITAKDGKDIFTQAGCGGCHTLKDAGTTGNVGPNLDQAKPSKALAIQRVTNGMGAMPPFKDKLTKEQIDAVATYVSSVAGK